MSLIAQENLNRTASVLVDTLNEETSFPYKAEYDCCGISVLNSDPDYSLTVTVTTKRGKVLVIRVPGSGGMNTLINEFQDINVETESTYFDILVYAGSEERKKSS